MRLLVLPLVMLLLWAPRAGAGERQEAAPRPAAPTRGAPVRELAYAHAVVTNARGQVLDGLTREMFTLLEHGAAKSIDVFEFNAPASVLFAVDQSGSMRGRDDASPSAFAENLKRAITAFASRRTAATDYALVRFAERPTLVVDFTADAESVAAAAGDLTTLGGRTALYDTFVFALARAEQSRRPKQAILLVSDGYDSRSGYSSKEVKRRAEASDAVVFSVFISRTREQLRGADLGPFPASDFRQIAEQTGGAYLVVGSDGDLTRAFELIALQLHHHYTIGFRPTATKRSEYRRLKIEPTEKLARQPGAEGVKVRARRGYRTLVGT